MDSFVGAILVIALLTGIEEKPGLPIRTRNQMECQEKKV